MVDVLKQLKFQVKKSDIKKYNGNRCRVADYTDLSTHFDDYSLLFTNPPYKFADKFALRGLSEARLGVALLLPSIWSTGKFRYFNVFEPHPPTKVAVFTKKMSATAGKVIRSGSCILSHSWFWWDVRKPTKLGDTRFVFLPWGAQAELERDGDYL